MMNSKAQVRPTQSRQKQLIRRLAGYFGWKILALAGVVALSVFLIIMIANYGGYIDKMVKSEIDFNVSLSLMTDTAIINMTSEEREQYAAETRNAMYEAAGLNEPFMSRTARWMWKGLTLDFGSPLGGAMFFPTPETDTSIRSVMLAHLPATLQIFGTSNLLIFIASVSAGMLLSRRYDSPLDRLVRVLAPMSALPAWFYGVLLGIFLVSAGLDMPPWALLILSIFLAGFFQSTHIWRSFFLLYSEEDYVEMAKARGLSERVIRQRYLLRPALPAILTNFALMLIGLFMGSIVLEAIFGWPGIGQLFFMGMMRNDTPLIVSIVVVYAYLLAMTIFILDVSYAAVDPRVRIGSDNQSVSASGERGGTRNLFRRKERFSPPEPAAGSGTSGWAGVTALPSAWASWFGEAVRSLRRTIHDINRYPAARRSLAYILFLIGLAVFTVIAIPYDLAITLWRGDGNIFIYYPKDALPEWINRFSREKLPPNIIFDTRDSDGERVEQVVTDEIRIVTTTFRFDYPYDALPQDLALYFEADFAEKQPIYYLYWETPDGRRLKLADVIGPRIFPFNITQAEEVQRKLKTDIPEKVLFTQPDAPDKVLKGSYALIVESYLFEKGSNVEMEFVLRGQVYGLAGTDYRRRDIMVELMWGPPIVLAFGLLGAVATNVLSMLIAAAGAWYGGWVDGLVQRITELNMALPAFPISLMVFVMYSKSIWVILGVTVVLGIFGSGVKTYRAAFLQIKESLYIEAARAYGASNTRIVLLYMLPRIVSVIVPQIIVAIPGFVFLEAALAFLGVSDPVFPTWGKLLVDTVFIRRGTVLSFDPANMAYHMGTNVHFYFGVLVPAFLLILLALSFNTLGGYLEKVLNPRLKKE